MSNLFIRAIQPHEVKAEHPHAQRLVVTGKDRPGEVVEPPPTGVALILLSFRLRFVASLFRDLGRVAVGQVTPWGQRIARTVSKHLASSMRFSILSILARTILVGEKRSVQSRLAG